MTNNIATQGNAFAFAAPGMLIRKESPQEKAFELLTKDLGDAVANLDAIKKSHEEQYRQLHGHFDGVKADNETLKKTVEEKTAEYASMSANLQAVTQAVDLLKKEMDQPRYKGGKELEDSDKKAAIELQRRIHLHRGGTPEDFRENLDDIIDASAYRSAVQKMMRVGIETKEQVKRSFTPMERKAFEAASLDSGMFSPEILGLTIDCDIECADLIPLYDQYTVTKSTFIAPEIQDYGAIGQYSCDASCEGELGPEGNIRWKAGSVSDFRGTFCLQKKVLQEANFPLLEFMMRAASRSHRINRNRALMIGDGINEPMGWLTASDLGKCFPKIATPAANPTHQDIRRFLASLPGEYGTITPVMHQNMFAYLSVFVDCCGRFIFGDGDLTFAPGNLENIRISNCLPDPTNGGVLGDVANPFVPGSFLMAAAAWKRAYAAIDKRPMWIEQYEGGSSPWCVKYNFGAEDGGFPLCCNAGRVLVAGAAN